MMVIECLVAFWSFFVERFSCKCSCVLLGCICTNTCSESWSGLPRPCGNQRGDTFEKIARTGPKGTLNKKDPLATLPWSRWMFY